MMALLIMRKIVTMVAFNRDIAHLWWCRGDGGKEVGQQLEELSAVVGDALRPGHAPSSRFSTACMAEPYRRSPPGRPRA